MEQIIDKLWVGSDKDDAHAASKEFAILRCCKDGPHSHRSMLGYTSKAAPDGPNYYYVQKGDKAALNLIDADDPNFIPAEAINFGLKFIQEQLDKDKNVLVHCNAGHSRGPTVALMFLRKLGEMPGNFHISEKTYKTLYPPFSPTQGIETFARTNWRRLLYEGETENV